MSTTVTYKGSTLTTVNNQTRVMKTAGKYMEDDVTLVDITHVSVLQSKIVTITPTTSSQSQTVTPDSGNDGLSQVTINVDAVPTGTEGTPIATKGTVSSHSVMITPSVVNSQGYISGGTRTGNPVTVSASELVSGNKAITDNGTNIDVINYATVSVNVPIGVDIPTFSQLFSADYSTYTASCDETFAECFNRYVNGDYRAQLWKHVDSPNDPWEQYDPLTAVDAMGNDYIVYIAPSAWGPMYDVVFHANGTIDIVQPSTYLSSLSVTQNGTYRPNKGVYSDVTVNVPSSTPTLQTITKIYTPTESQQTDTITPGSGYDGIGEVDVTVNAISSTYVGTGITRRSSSDLTANGATVTAPAGYYVNSASKAVASGTEGTPIATKGAVSNHSVSITPSVTNSAGYISGGTKTGTAVTVTASELVSGSETKTANGTYDVTNLAQLVVNVPSGKNVQAYLGYDDVASTSYTATDVSVTVTKTGTYRVSWVGWRTTTSGTSGSRLYVNGVATGNAVTTFTGNYGQSVVQTNVALEEGDVVVVRARSRNTSYRMYVANLIIEEV